MIDSFDQYQRYRTLGNIISKIQHENFNGENLRILEVGANAQRNLGKFVGAEIFYTDIEMMDGFEGDDHFFVADATNLEGVDNGAYDIVVAADVFEHIPHALREAFISEIYRVAGIAALICFPQGKSYVSRAEDRVNQFYRSITGEDYIWLKEHIQNGLPDLKLLDGYLEKNNICHKKFEHGSIAVWEMMYKAHFYSVVAEELIDYRKYIDHIYITDMYPYDVSSENYRVFYLMYKDREDSGYFAKLIDGLFVKSEEAVQRGRKKLDSQINDLHQIIAVRNRQDRNTEYASLCPLCCYYDYGEGYSEREKDAFKKVSLETNNLYHIDLCGRENVKKLRIDFLENQFCEVYDFQIWDDMGNPLPYITNAFRNDHSLIFLTYDPQIIVEDLRGINSISLSFMIAVAETKMETLFLNHKVEWIQNCLCIEEDRKKILEEKNNAEDRISELQTEMHAKNELVSALEQTNNELQRENNELKNAKNVLQNEKNVLQNKLNIAEDNYKLIVNSHFWRMTKPARVIVSALKKVRLIRCFGRIAISLKRNGIGKTIKLMREKKEGMPDANDVHDFAKVSVKEVEEDIKFSIIVPLYNTDLKCLRELLDSVKKQNYSNWELILGDASTEKCNEIEEICKEYIGFDDRIQYYKIANNGISENSNFCASKAQGEYLVLCDHDDILNEQALRANADVIHETGADVLYSDEDHLDKNGNHVFPLYKPDWSIDLLRSQMYICHLLVFKKSIFEGVGGFQKEYDGSQDYDLMLRFVEQTEKIVHIPMVLYSWREIETSTAANAYAKPYATDAGLRALNAHLQRVYGDAAQASKTEYPFVFDTKYGLLEKYQPMVSIIIPMRDQHRLSDQCIKSIIQHSSYAKYEIIIINNRSKEGGTFKWFEEIVKFDERIRIIDADFEFNWSKLNNYGLQNAKGDIFVFLNNDTKIISEDWLEKLCDYALRDDVGVVGPMLLYEDDTIQHAGIIVGMGGWADHVFKAMKPEHFGSPFISPMVNRNVMAVTGACMAVSRKTIDMIGTFDEEFIICGSDVELCIRAFENGLNNVFHAGIRLYHLESKSRDSYIPEVDFQKSYECYGCCRTFGDPYYNINLDVNSQQPREDVEMDWNKIKEHIKNNRFTAGMYQHAKEQIVGSSVTNAVRIPEVQEICARKIELPQGKIRINALIPSVSIKHVFGGIATALDFYEHLSGQGDFLRRIVITDDSDVSKETMVDSLRDYNIIESAEDVVSDYQIVPFADRAGKTLPVAEKDVFLATGWWTAYTIADVIRWQIKEFGSNMPLIYLIQDYEPGFYPWSSRYLMADSTYQLEMDTIAVINSGELYDFMQQRGYRFHKAYYFEPRLNATLKDWLDNNGDKARPRKKQLLVYGRPGVERNAFAVIVAALKRWVAMQQNIDEWNIISAGESFEDIDLGKGKVLHSIGKVSLEEYAKIMLETKVGLSLMVSPHPSYPPLEMSAFGVRVVTNQYANKDLKDFNGNIISIANCSAMNIANVLCDLCDGDDGVVQREGDYVKGRENGLRGKMIDEIISEVRL